MLIKQWINETCVMERRKWKDKVGDKEIMLIKTMN